MPWWIAAVASVSNRMGTASYRKPAVGRIRAIATVGESELREVLAADADGGDNGHESRSHGV